MNVWYVKVLAWEDENPGEIPRGKRSPSPALSCLRASQYWRLHHLWGQVGVLINIYEDRDNRKGCNCTILNWGRFHCSETKLDLNDEMSNKHGSSIARPSLGVGRLLHGLSWTSRSTLAGGWIIIINVNKLKFQNSFHYIIIFQYFNIHFIILSFHIQLIMIDYNLQARVGHVLPAAARQQTNGKSSPWQQLETQVTLIIFRLLYFYCYLFNYLFLSF